MRSVVPALLEPPPRPELKGMRLWSDIVMTGRMCRASQKSFAAM